MMPPPSERGSHLNPGTLGYPERWVTRERQLPQIAHFLYHALRAKDLPGIEVVITVNTLIQQSRQYERSFLMWELVRHLGAKEVVGLVEDDNLGQIVPATGFEGYFAGSGKTPGEIVLTIANYGVTLAAKLRKQGTDITQFEQTIRGEYTREDVVSTWILADQVFRQTLEEFHGIVPAMHNLKARYLYDSFRSTNLDLLRDAPPILHEPNILAPQPEYALTYWIPKEYPLTNTAITRVPLTNQQWRGHDLMSGLGVTGTPMHRAILAALSPQTGYIEAMTPIAV